MMNRAKATFYNVLNLLAPILLAVGIALIVASRSAGEKPAADWLGALGAILTLSALAVRIIWGLGIRKIKKQKNDIT